MHARSIALAAPMLLWSGCLTAQRSVGPGAAADAAIAHPYRPGIDVLDYNLSLELPARGNEIAGDAVLSLRRTARVDTLVLDLVGLVVDSVRVDGVRASFSRPAGEIHVALPQGVTGTFRVDVAYRGAVEDGLIIRTDGAGRWTGFGDNWPNRARYWIPSVDHPSDKATVSWNITAPADRTVVANGVLVDRTTLSDGRVRTRWREEHPIAVYLMVVAAAPLSEYSLGQTACGLASDGRCVPQYVYTAPEQRTMLPGAFAQAAEIVRYFSSLVGAFPYEKLRHNQLIAPHLYSRILDSAYGALKAANHANLIIGGMSDPAAAITPQQWIENMRLPDGQPPRFDMYGHNPFSVRVPDLSNPPSINQQFDFSDLSRLSEFVDKNLGRPGNPKPKLFLSEWTIPTAQDLEFNYHVEQRVQALWITDGLRIASELPSVYALGWIHLYDELPQQAGGLIKVDGTKKLGYFAWEKG